MKTWKGPSTTVILLNGAAILIALASIGTVVRSVLLTERVTSCKERYENATRFSLDIAGVAMTTADIQGRMSNSDWGLIHGGRVVKLKSGPSKFALELDLASVPTASKGSEEKRAGIGFNWAPQSFSKAKAACLTYSVFLPEGFVFGAGGRLPGLHGGAQRTTEDDAATAFSSRYTWSATGEAGIHTHLPGWAEGRSLSNKLSWEPLLRGEWVELEQEVILNAPDRKDGILRVWQNGRLVFQNTDLTFRSKPSVLLSGVLAETVGGEQPAGTKLTNQKIWMTPFELRW